MKHAILVVLFLASASTRVNAQHVVLELDPTQSNWTWSIYVPPPLNVWAVPTNTDQFQLSGRVGGPFVTNAAGHVYSGQFTDGQMLIFPDIEGHVPGPFGIHLVTFRFYDVVIRKESWPLEFGPEATSDGTCSGDQWFHFLSGTAEGSVFGVGSFSEELAGEVTPPQWHMGAFTTLPDGRLHFEATETLYFQVTDSTTGLSFDITFTGNYFADQVFDIVSYCSGDGSGGVCPCGNSAGIGEGCMNGSGLGGKLETSGTSSISDDSLTLLGSQLAPSQPGLYFQGNNAVNSGDGNPFGDGLRCAGGGVHRLQVGFADSSGSSQTSISISASGAVSPGDVKRYQLWYRDPITSFCGFQFNLSNGIEVTWSA